MPQKKFPSRPSIVWGRGGGKSRGTLSLSFGGGGSIFPLIPCQGDGAIGHPETAPLQQRVCHAYAAVLPESDPTSKGPDPAYVVNELHQSLPPERHRDGWASTPGNCRTGWFDCRARSGAPVTSPICHPYLPPICQKIRPIRCPICHPFRRERIFV